MKIRSPHYLQECSSSPTTIAELDWCISKCFFMFFIYFLYLWVSRFQDTSQLTKTTWIESHFPLPRRHASPILLWFMQTGVSVGIASSCNRSSPRQNKFKIIALCPSTPKLFGVIILQSPDTQAWQNDYLQGTGCEMYTETLSPSFTGMTFPQASE